MDNVEQLLLNIIRGIVEFPNEVSIKTEQTSDVDGELTNMLINVAPQDIGLCIGAKGANAESLRRIIAMYAYRQLEKRVHIHVNAPKSFRL